LTKVLQNLIWDRLRENMTSKNRTFFTVKRGVTMALSAAVFALAACGDKQVTRNELELLSPEQIFRIGEDELNGPNARR